MIFRPLAIARHGKPIKIHFNMLPADPGWIKKLNPKCSNPRRDRQKFVCKRKNCKTEFSVEKKIPTRLHTLTLSTMVNDKAKKYYP